MNNTYYNIVHVDKKELLNNGFRVVKNNMEENPTDWYQHRFQVCTYNNKPTLVGELLIDTDKNKLIVNVYDMNCDQYIPFYFQEYGNYKKILNKINKKIKNELSNKKINIIGGTHIV